MHIALCGPITLSTLAPRLDEPLRTGGYPFPGLSELALKYLDRGNRLTVVTTGSDISSPQHYRAGDLQLHVIPSRPRARARALDFFAAERAGIYQTLNEARPEVIHAHWSYEFGLAARATVFPSLVTVHDWAPAIAKFNKHPYWYFRALMQMRCLSKPGLLSAPSSYVAEKVRKYYRRDCEVIANGVDLGKYGFESSDRHRSMKIGMLNVGFSARKNVGTALMAWPQVRRQFPTAELDLAGPGYELGGPAWLFARDNGLLEGVNFQGAIDRGDIPTWFRSKTIFLHTSLEESFGMVIAEAMASGVPVVAGDDSGAIAEITSGTALLANVRSQDAIASSVNSLLGSESIRQAMSSRGYRAAEAFSLDKVTDRYLGLLASC